MSKKSSYISVIGAIVAIVGFLMLFVAPRLAYAGGGAGGGGSGTGGSGGGQTSNGWGWARYSVTPDSGGPTHEPFRDGTTTWNKIQNTCYDAGATSIDIFIIDWSDGGGQGYNYKSVYTGPPLFAGHFTAGQKVDHNSATAISTATAQADWQQAKADGVNTSGLTFGNNVAWFCSHLPKSPTPVAGCTATPKTQNMPAGGSATINLHGTLPNGGSWPNTYYIRRFPAGSPQFAGYHDITNPGPNGAGRNGPDNVSPPYTVTYKYFIASSDGDQTKSGQAGGQVIGSNTCTSTVNVVSPPMPSAKCTSPAAPDLTPGQSYGFVFVFNIVNPTSSALAVTYNSENVTGGVTNVSAPAPPGSSIATTNSGGQNVNVTITATINYAGTIGAYVSDSSGILAHCPVVTITPTVKPYFQAWQNDASAGGGFADQSGLACPGYTGGYISPQAVGGVNGKYAGGIRAMSSPTIQAKSDFGAVALGQIPVGGNQGFYAGFGNGSLRAWFANSINPPGSLNPAGPGNCVLDYYDTTSSVKPSQLTLLGDLHNDLNPASCPLDSDTNSYRCAFQAPDGTVINGPPIVIPHGYQVSIYVPGNITINTNITLDNFNPNSRADIPYFTVIAKGNISLSDNVTRLDGLYIAQPQGDASNRIIANTGVFATCDQSISGGQCTHQLEVDGAVVAQHVELLREHGSSQPLGSDANNIGTNPAEIFNFVPSMVLGAPGINAQPSLPQGLFSLPPVF